LFEDHKHHKDAAETLEPLVKSTQNEGRAAQYYSRLREYYSNSELLDPEKLKAKYHFNRGQQHLEDKDYKGARAEFELAINTDPDDADTLIAMFRMPESDDKWLESVRKKIGQLADKTQRQIDDDPSDPTPYNDWAWLISNTEGDFQKAIRYSHRSLELNDRGKSGEASYMDTLGRCYYAAGDYENAVKYQRQACERQDYMQVMQRQLALFEKKLAEKKAASGEK
jgi:tetratricopeptide (TPR) repeat protein